MSTSKSSNIFGDQNDHNKSNREVGYYWVMHDYMWFLTQYSSSEDVFYFPGQYIGFDPQSLQKIDERRIERKITRDGCLLSTTVSKIANYFSKN